MSQVQVDKDRKTVIYTMTQKMVKCSVPVTLVNSMLSE